MRKLLIALALLIGLAAGVFTANIARAHRALGDAGAEVEIK